MKKVLNRLNKIDITDSQCLDLTNDLIDDLDVLHDELVDLADDFDNSGDYAEVAGRKILDIIQELRAAYNKHIYKEINIKLESISQEVQR